MFAKRVRFLIAIQCLRYRLLMCLCFVSLCPSYSQLQHALLQVGVSSSAEHCVTVPDRTPKLQVATRVHLACARQSCVQSFLCDLRGTWTSRVLVACVVPMLLLRTFAGCVLANQLVRPSGQTICATFMSCFLRQVLSKAARATVRILAEGHPASSGLLEVQTSSGSFGSVCGMNAEAASVACRQLGFDFGVLSPSPCGQYGGGSWCGAAGSPVAVKSLKCSGTEISVDECSSEPVDDTCMSHGSDAVVFCGASSVEAFPDGELRLIGPAGAPALPGEAGRLEIFLATSEAWAPVCRLGFTSGSAAVACKQMGFTGASGYTSCRSKEACGGVAPQLSELACTGSETSVLQCPMAVGDDVFCAPEESVLLTCAGPGDPIGKPAVP